jgi:MFS superfamily sulfate permease-like transporter
MNRILSHAGSDIPAAVVVFLVALPLCLGVALASGAPLLSGVVAGVVGGIVIGIFSGSSLSVSGPAAGLTAIVAGALAELPSFEVFLLSVVIAGVLQIVLGYLKAGIIGDFIPNAVIKGMLAAIGLILILKQLPHLVGYDADPEGDESFFQIDGQNTFSEIFLSLNHLAPAAIIIGFVSLLVLMMYELKFFKKNKIFQLIPGPLIVVLVGASINAYLQSQNSRLFLNGDHLVVLPVTDHPGAFFAQLNRPDWSGLFNVQVWITGVTLAIVASLETLLSLEAIDKLDPEKRLSPTNRELKAQGIGNMISGLLGGLPVTSVIVRSSANVSSGAKSKLSTILHGFLLLLSVLFIPQLLNLIPKAALAAILIFTGYKLAKISIFKEYWAKGLNQFLPFVITIVAILFTDLLIGICVGIVAGLYFIIRSNFHKAILIIKDEHRYLIRFAKEVSFMNKGYLKTALENIPDDRAILIDASKSTFVDQDVIDLVNDFVINAESRNIRIYFKQKPGESQNIFHNPHPREMK